MRIVSDIAAWIFGATMLGLALFVTADVVCRKFIGMSFEGADELGGYALAVGAGLAFVVAMVNRAHMRVDVIYARLSVRFQAMLDLVALATLLGMALLLMLLGWQMLSDSLAYRSTAPTIWATPLAWPQSAWLGTLVMFALICAIALAQGIRMALQSDWHRLNNGFGTSPEKDELEAELADLQRRT
ncbi:TRAP transporter small permease [Paracoccus sp. 1_MG-2023]|uniref:TRAP transporter small permease subunit n=1 Tax=unclassified Paracoccus (in: a-proteobacteria) TaxID=2688777 RepID=UPI001C090800|nr:MULTISPECIES: TRAP transporter small permease [unclassified Paracoccus (in: a-proteobacteria)]MBU2959118.1 TRAP transporter small permease [Paracoccus sp. C2R09]MDO6669402.1 TRAP transporter small permease [Paracoccus sp. 1_MG-2023]